MYSRGMKVGPPGGVNISRCMTASTARATLTRNSSQTRRGRACSPASSKGSSAPSPSIHRRMDSSSPTVIGRSSRRRLIQIHRALSHPAASGGILIIALDRHLNLVPAIIITNAQNSHTRALLNGPQRLATQVRLFAQPGGLVDHAFMPDRWIRGITHRCCGSALRPLPAHVVMRCEKDSGEPQDNQEGYECADSAPARFIFLCGRESVNRQSVC